MDETGLNYRARPLRTLDKQSSKGSKISKERITLALTCNSTGTERLRPLVIHTSKNPRSFKQEREFDVAHYVDYHFNEKAWMTQEVRENSDFAFQLIAPPLSFLQTESLFASQTTVDAVKKGVQYPESVKPV